jgi:hypothetical protein
MYQARPKRFPGKRKLQLKNHINQAQSEKKALNFARISAWLIAAWLGGGLAPWVHAGVPAVLAFQHKDWALVCDNTRTCRAEGYQADSVEAPSDPVSMLITRTAGPGTVVSMDLKLEDDTDPKRRRAMHQLLLGTVKLTGLAADKDGVIHLSPEQVALVGPELLHQKEARVVSGAGRMAWRLSLEGVYAVLLKMDEAQGRLDTPGALVRRGKRDEASVLPPVAPPVIRGAVPLVDAAGEKGLARRIWASVDAKEILADCNETEPAPEPQLFRLTRHRLLLSVACPMGAYNFTNLLFMAQDTLPYKVTRLEATGDFDPATGSVKMAMKGRGLGDCWSTTQWQFDGEAFVLSGDTGSAMCRGFAGGAWPMPRYVTRIDMPSGTSPK